MKDRYGNQSINFNSVKKTKKFHISSYTKEEIWDMLLEAKEDIVYEKKQYKILENAFEKIKKELLRVCNLYNTVRGAFKTNELKLKLDEYQRKEKIEKQLKKSNTQIFINLNNELDEAKEKIKYLENRNQIFFAKLEEARKQLKDISRFNEPSVWA